MPPYRNSYVLQAFTEHPWAILPRKLTVLQEIVVRHASGEKLDPEEVQTRIHGAVRPPDRRISAPEPGTAAVAVLPLFGTIFPRGNLMTNVSGATSAEAFGAQFQALVNDPEIDAIILDVDSPGGQVDGIAELSSQIYAARGTKPVVAVSNHTMASAAYWVASAADEVVVTPSGSVGSVGVFAVHEDISRALQNDGVNVSIISAGKYKVEGNPYQPLSDEARAAIQASVNETYTAFVEALARNRGVAAETVRGGFGEGRMVRAEQAVQMNMADRVATLNQTVNRLLTDAVQQAHSTNELTDPHQGPSQPGAESVVIEHPAAAREPSPDGEQSERQAESLREEIRDFQKRSKAWI